MKSHEMTWIQARLNSGEPDIFYCDGKRISKREFNRIDIAAKRKDSFHTYRTKRDREHGKFHHSHVAYLVDRHD